MNEHEEKPKSAWEKLKEINTNPSRMVWASSVLGPARRRPKKSLPPQPKPQ